jgi:hypothetical protein
MKKLIQIIRRMFKHPTAQEKYLSQATSLADLERLQKEWCRKHRYL